MFACHYCYGTGLSMTMARHRIANFVGEHIETLRNWDRSLLANVTLVLLPGFYREERIIFQIAGAVESGAVFDDAKRRLKLDANAEHWLYWWGYFHDHPFGWDDKYFAELGHDYQRALKEQKQLVQRRRR
jgi:hypothetical protein